MDSKRREPAGSTPILVANSCGHIHAYTVPGWLDEADRQVVAAELTREPCVHCDPDQESVDVVSSLTCDADPSNLGLSSDQGT